MASRFEPCGLNQMYSMRYGTVPVVRATGGLDDTVADYNPRTNTGTGFKFSDYTSAALLGALDRARQAFANPNIWKKLQLAGMRQDFSWDRSAGEYVKLYEAALNRAKG
jgi:starch synthase